MKGKEGKGDMLMRNERDCGRMKRYDDDSIRSGHNEGWENEKRKKELEKSMKFRTIISSQTPLNVPLIL